MRSIIILTNALVYLFFLGCSNGAKKASSYADSLMLIQQESSKAATELLSNMDSYNDTIRAFAAIDTLNRQLDLSIKKAERISFDGDSVFKLSLLNTLKIYQGFTKAELREISRLLSKSDSLFTRVDSSRLHQLSKDITIKSGEAEKKLKEVQREFAQKHQLILEKTKPR